MFRKVPLTVGYCLAPCDLMESVRELVVNKIGGYDVVYVDKSVVELAKHQLDPRVSNISSILKSGDIIDPSGFLNVLGVTDQADLDARMAPHYQFLDEYVTRHQKEIDKLLSNLDSK